MTLVALFLRPAAFGEDAGQSAWRVVLEPRFMRQQVTQPVANAERTDLAAALWKDDAPEPLTRAAFEALGVSWSEFARRAAENATADLAQLKPVYVRNKKRIIQYAILRSASPIVASAILAPGVGAMFEETLGPNPLIAVPNQYVAYLFPKLASNYEEYAPLIEREYKATPHPVSRELFELTAAGLRGVGEFTP